MSGRPKVSKVKQRTDPASRSEQPRPVKVAQECPNKNWIELVYKYNSQRAVSNASYEVYDADTNQSVACGQLDNMGFARIEGLPDKTKKVKFLFTSDPKPFEIYPGYKPGRHNLTPETKEVKEEDGTVVSVAKWLGTALAGDFVDDQTYGQIAFGTVVTLIPVVDQVGDVRDIVANLYKLTFEKKYNEFSPWFGLVVTIIGCVPEVGSVVKGVCKTLFKAIADGAKKLPLNGLIKALNSVGEGNVIKFLRDILAKIQGWGTDAGVKIKQLLDEIKKKLQEWYARAFYSVKNKIGEVLETIEEIYKRDLLPTMVGRFIDFIKTHLKNTIDEATDFAMEGVTRARNGATQLKEKFFKNIAQDLGKIAERAGMPKEHLENLVKHCNKNDRLVVVRCTNPASLRFQGDTFKDAAGNVKQYLPKPLAVKLNTGKKGEVPDHLAGLVMRPKHPDADQLKDIESLKAQKYTFDDDGVLHDPQGNRFYGDYDVQSVHRRVDMENKVTGQNEPVYLNEMSNPKDGDVIDEMNHDLLGKNAPENQRPFQHGGEGDFRLQVDEKGNKVKKDGKPVMVSAEDLNTGGKNGAQMKHGKDYKLGRQYGADEKYLVVDPDGNFKIAENPEELKQLYKEIGMPWEYDPRLAIAPAGQAQAVMGAKRAAESDQNNKNE